MNINGLELQLLQRCNGASRSNSGHRYELYHKKAVTTSEPGYPATVAPCQDGDFSEKTWDQGGYNDIDPYASYREVFNGSLAMYQNPN